MHTEELFGALIELKCDVEIVQIVEEQANLEWHITRGAQRIEICKAAVRGRDNIRLHRRAFDG